MSSKCDICKHRRGLMCYHPERVLFNANGDFVGMRHNSGQFDCIENKYHFCEPIDTIRTDNSQTLVNAEKRIEELEAIKDDWKRLAQAADTSIEELKAIRKEQAEEINRLESQRNRLLAALKKNHKSFISEWVSWEYHTSSECDPQCSDCALIREIEGGR